MWSLAQLVVILATVICSLLMGASAGLAESERVDTAQSSELLQLVQHKQRHQTAHVETLVRDNQGRPLRGIGVVVHDLDGETVARSVTNNQGKVVFECLPFGHYRMDVAALRTYRQYWQGGTTEFLLDHEGRFVTWTASEAVAAVADLAPSSIGCPCYAQGEAKEDAEGKNSEQTGGLTPLETLYMTEAAHALPTAHGISADRATQRLRQAVYQRTALQDDAAQDKSFLAANIEAFVADRHNNPLVGVGVVVRDEDGWIVAQEETDERGYATIACLELGDYSMEIEPHRDRWQGGAVEFSLGQEGQTVNWVTSARLPAVSRLLGEGGLCQCGGGFWWSKEALSIPFSIGVGLGVAGIEGVFHSGLEPFQLQSVSSPVSPSQ